MKINTKFSTGVDLALFDCLMSCSDQDTLPVVPVALDLKKLWFMIVEFV